MALSHRSKRRLSLVILLVGLPVYVFAMAWFLGAVTLPIWLKLVLYAVSGVLWALPFKQVFLGVGQADPDAPPPEAPEQ